MCKASVMATVTSSLRFHDFVYPLKVEGKIRDPLNAPIMRAQVVGETSPKRVTCQTFIEVSHLKC